MTRNWSLSARYYVLTVILILAVLLGWVVRELFGPLVIAENLVAGRFTIDLL